MGRHLRPSGEQDDLYLFATGFFPVQHLIAAEAARDVLRPSDNPPLGNPRVGRGARVGSGRLFETREVKMYDMRTLGQIGGSDLDRGREVQYAVLSRVFA
jgi:hypothetical protein